jgi:hypothetical protein
MTDLGEVRENELAVLSRDPELLERGRHAITGMADGSWVITRAGPLCERCSECGCGEQQEPIVLPSFAVNLLMMDPEKRAKLNPMTMVRNMMGGKGNA